MSTPMETNLLKLREAMASFEVADASLYKQISGSLMYLINTKPDICYVVNALSQFMVEPKQLHMSAAEHILRYLRGTIEYGLLYKKCKIGTSWFYRLRLGRVHYRPKEYIRMLF